MIIPAECINNSPFTSIFFFWGGGDEGGAEVTSHVVKGLFTDLIQWGEERTVFMNARSHVQASLTTD